MTSFTEVSIFSDKAKTLQYALLKQITEVERENTKLKEEYTHKIVLMIFSRS